LKKNQTKDFKTKIICKYNNNIYNDEIILRNKICLPYLLTSKSLSIADKIDNTKNKINFFHSPDNRGDKKHIKKKKDEKHIYLIQLTGTQIGYSSKPCKNQYDNKVLISRSGYLRPKYDKGELGVGGDCFCCLVNDKIEGENIIKLINCKLYKFYTSIFKWSGFHHIKVLKQLPYIKLKEITDENIYKYFNLTDDEIKIIEDNVKDKKLKKLSKNVDEEKTDSNNDKNETTNSNSLYTKKELKKKKYTLSKLQDIAKGLNIPTQIPKTGKKKGMKNKSKADLINDILNCD
jgi:hypothetical protein